GESTETVVGNTLVGDHIEGFGFLKGVAVDQHVLKRNRQFDLIPVIEAHPELLGIGIDEDTSVLIEDNRRLTVVGKTQVMFVNSKKGVQPFSLSFLNSGGRFDLRKLRVMK
ncbi:MAG: peptidase S51, partial [Pyrinomonadaceae bacterium]